MPVDLPRGPVSADDASRAADEVLARPELRDSQPGLLDRLSDEVMSFIGRMIDTAAGTAVGRVIGTVLVIAIVAGAAYAVYRIVRRVQASGHREEVVGAEDVGRPPTDWLADADAAEADERWREAVRCRWRAVVAELAARGRLEEMPGRTAGEHAAAVRRDAPEIAAAFGDATAAFQEAWYASGPVGPDHVARVRRAAEAVERGANGRTARDGLAVPR